MHALPWQTGRGGGEKGEEEEEQGRVLIRSPHLTPLLGCVRLCGCMYTHMYDYTRMGVGR